MAKGAGKLTNDWPPGSAIKMSMRFLIVPVLFLASAVAVPAADEPGIIKGSDQFEFVYRVKLPEIKGDARVWLPLAKTERFQTVTEEELSIAMKWEKVQDRDYANDICVFDALPADSGKTIELRYHVVRKEKAAYPASNADAARYLRPEKLVPVNETFKTLALDAVAGKKDDLERAKALYDHVVARMRYDKSGTGWGRGDAVYACDARTGNCSDFHAYFIALARSIGIPARCAIGAAPVIALLAKGHEQRVLQLVVVRLRIAGDADGDLRLRNVEPECPVNPVPPREYDAEIRVVLALDLRVMDAVHARRHEHF